MARKGKHTGENCWLEGRSVENREFRVPHATQLSLAASTATVWLKYSLLHNFTRGQESTFYKIYYVGHNNSRIEREREQELGTGNSNGEQEQASSVAKTN